MNRAAKRLTRLLSNCQTNLTYQPYLNEGLVHETANRLESLGMNPVDTGRSLKKRSKMEKQALEVAVATTGSDSIVGC